MNSKKILLMIITMIFASTFTIFSINAVQDFNVSTNTVTQTVNVSTTNTISITIGSTGNENINLNTSKVDLVSGSNSIVLTLNPTSFTNLENGTTATLTGSYTANAASGTYIGSITVENADNSSQTETISVTIIVESITVAGASVELVGETSTLLFPIDIDDNSEKKTFVLKNNGNVKLNDIEIDLDSKFEGDDDNIDDDDFEINSENGDDTYSLIDEDNINYLDIGETFNIKLSLDIPSNLDVDDYKGDFIISYIPEGTTARVSQTFTLKITGTSDNEDVYIEQSALDVFSGKLKVFIEPGETIDDIEFRVVNDASFDVEGITFELDSDLEEENSANTLSKAAVTFLTDNLDIYDNDDEDIEIEITIPSTQSVGTYTTDLLLISSTGKELDSIELEIEIIGDIYIESIDFNANVNPGSYLDIPIIIKNKGSSTQRNVRVKGSLFDIDSSNSDIYESSSNFLLENGASRTETLRFKIPKDASAGSHILEIMVEYDDSSLTQIENIEVIRPTHKMNIESYAVNPTFAKCQDSVYTYLKFQNLGKYDEDVKVTAEIEGTDVKQSTNTLTINVDEIMQKSLVLNIEQLTPGTYNLIQKVQYGSLVEKRETDLKINVCTKATVEGIDIKEINDSNNYNETFTNEDKTEIFGQEMEKTTAYLIGGVGTTFLLIVLALFLL